MQRCRPRTGPPHKKDRRDKRERSAEIIPKSKKKRLPQPHLPNKTIRMRLKHPTDSPTRSKSIIPRPINYEAILQLIYASNIRYSKIP